MTLKYCITCENVQEKNFYAYGKNQCVSDFEFENKA